MGDNIVRRGPGGKATRQHERSPTTEMGKDQLRALIREHEDPHADLEPELELIDGAEAAAADGAPPGPGALAPRLAHTLRRGARRVAASAVLPAPGSPSDRPDASAIAIPRRERSSRRMAARRPMERTELPPIAPPHDPAAAALPGAAEIAERASADVTREPAATGEPKRPVLRTRWRSRVILAIAVLVVIGGAATFWLCTLR